MQKIRRRSAQNPLMFYLDALLYALLMSLIYAASFAPLLALFLFDGESPLRYLALLCPLLCILIVLPLRFSFAQALTGRYHHATFSLREAFNFSLYGEKVAEGVVYVLHLIKWTLPLAAAGGVLYYLYLNTEVFSLIKGITNFGTAATAVWNGLLGFFGAKDLLPGGITEGLLAIPIIVGACLLFLLWGVVRNSAYRYLWAEATELDKNPRLEARRSLRGRRLKQLGAALINLALLMPALIALYRIVAPKETIEQLANQYADAFVSEIALPAIVIPYGKLAIVFFAFFLPLLPIRRMITAYFATARIRRQMQPPEPAQANGGAQGQMPPLYEDKPDAPTGRKP
jgi:hypothetical protein